jgi:dipeptidyl aminopeptidase/acylaminoacyl peptidase
MAAPKFQAHHAALLAAGRGFDAANISRPLLLIHGDEDPVIPLEQAHALTHRLKADSHLMVIPGGGHTFRRPEDVRSILAAELTHLRFLSTT